MDHYGMLRDYRFSDNVDNVRGASLYGADGDKLGKIDDVIFDHATGTIQYAVVDTGGWLSSKKFLVPADRIHPDAKNKDDFAIDATKQQIEALPKYDENAVSTDTAWTDYDKRYRTAWEHGPLLQKQGSTHTITPEPDELPAARAPAWTTRPTCRTGLRENFPRPVRIPISCACAPPGWRPGRKIRACRERSSRKKSRRWPRKKMRTARPETRCRRNATT